MIMGTKEKLADMKEALKKSQDEYTRNKGVYDSKLQELKDDYGFNDLSEARDALKRMDKKLVVMTKRLDDSINDFTEKYKDLLR